MVIIRQINVIAGMWLIMMRVVVLFARVKWVKWVLYAAFMTTHAATTVIAIQIIRVLYRMSLVGGAEGLC
jgi:hypothetical protein